MVHRANTCHHQLFTVEFLNTIVRTARMKRRALDEHIIAINTVRASLSCCLERLPAELGETNEEEPPPPELPPALHAPFPGLCRLCAVLCASSTTPGVMRALKP